MAISRYEEMGELEFDILKEIGSIGGGNAATALSSMLNAKVNMSMPAVKVLGFNAALNLLGDPEELVAAIFVEMSEYCDFFIYHCNVFAGKCRSGAVCPAVYGEYARRHSECADCGDGTAFGQDHDDYR